MTYALIFLAVIMATVIGYLLSQTLNREPWMADDVLENRPAGRPQILNPQKIGLGIFLAVVTSLFGLFFSAYSMRMGLSDWLRVDEPRVLWANTGVLVLASVAMQWALNAARKDNIATTRTGLMLGGALTFVFLGGQLLAWRQLEAAGLFMQSNPATAFFYLLTALHGLHVLGGLWVWGGAMVKLKGKDKLGETRLSIELCTVYWHYLLLVWFFLFTLLLMT